MNLVKLVIALLLDAGAVLAFAGHGLSSPAETALPLCPPPDSAGLYASAEPDSRSTRPTTEHAHENK